MALERADAVAGVAFFAPTGRYTAGASDNLGKAMWSYEVSGGTTFYLDQRAVVQYRDHGVLGNALEEGGRGSHRGRHGQRCQSRADLLTLEGGIGKSFLHGAASVGVAYYAQWKLTSDEMAFSNQAGQTTGSLDRHRVWGVGPDVTIPIATKTRIISLVNVRYLWETGAQIKTQGQSLLVTSTFPIGGIKIPGR